MPELVGSRKPRQAFAAMAASTAEPPCLRISMAASVASGCAVPAAPEHTHGGGAAGEAGAGDAVAGVDVRAAEMFFAFGLEFGEREINCVGFCRRILSERSGANGSCCDGQRGDKRATAQMALQSQG